MKARTPFDDVIDAIHTAGFHNQRLEEHSDLVSNGIFRDLLTGCADISDDFASGVVKKWENVPSPGARKRLADLFVGKPDSAGKPNAREVRIVVEHKSVITAHRNKTNRIDDLKSILAEFHAEKPEAILIATVLVGTASRVLNVPDQVKKRFRKDPKKFEDEIRPRLSTGDESLWEEFDYAVSPNRPDDAAKTVALFRSLPKRHPGQTHIVGYDDILIVPVFIDNVNPPQICRKNDFGIDIDTEYDRMLEIICRAYQSRWHF